MMLGSWRKFIFGPNDGQYFDWCPRLKRAACIALWEQHKFSCETQIYRDIYVRYAGPPNKDLEMCWPDFVPYEWDKRDHDPCNPLHVPNFRGYGGENKGKFWARFQCDAPPLLPNVFFEYQIVSNVWFKWQEACAFEVLAGTTCLGNLNKIDDDRLAQLD